jgi:sortase A
MMLASAGLLLLGHGLWIPAKAALAQVLLARAWQRAQAGERAPRAWPWADHTPVARIFYEKSGVSLLVLSGATGSSLAFAPGHVDGTAPPGADGNAAVGGHRDTHFRFLKDVALGDEIVVETRSGETVRYRVTDAAVVDERDVRPLAPTTQRALTLITCWPFDAVQPGGTERYVVRAVSDPAPAIKSARTEVTSRESRPQGPRHHAAGGRRSG